MLFLQCRSQLHIKYERRALQGALQEAQYVSLGLLGEKYHVDNRIDSTLRLIIHSD